MPFGFDLVQFYQANVEFVYQIGENLEITAEIIHCHIPQHPIGGRTAARKTIPHGWDKLPAGDRYKTRASDYLPVQFIQVKTLVPVLFYFFRKYLNQIPGLLFQRELEQCRPDKAVGDIRPVVFSYTFN